VRALLAHMGVTASVVVATITVYDQFVVLPALRIGVVDVSEVYRQKEAAFALSLTRATSDAEREQAMRVARAFAQRLPAALEDLPRQCGCLVVLRTALAAPSPRTVDLTAELRHMVEKAETP
jgi:hypothetical protein